MSDYDEADWAALRANVARRTRGPSHPLTAEIAAELYKAIERLDAGSDLLSIIGSYGDTLSDQEVLDLLREWNRTGRALTPLGRLPRIKNAP